MLLSSSPRKAAVIGWPISHSLSPSVHRFWLQSYKISGTYEGLAIRPDDLPFILRKMKDNGFCGFNLTVPHKEAATELVDDYDDIVKIIGAINLVTLESDGKIYGRNTDVYGFRENILHSGYKPKGGPAFVLGSGGAARAVIFALREMGINDIRLTNRTLARAEKLSREFSTRSCHISPIDWSEKDYRLSDSELLINTTSLGMMGQAELDISLEKLPGSAVVVDIVYRPLQTNLLKSAAHRGNPVIDGLGMLLHQARPSFAAFFGYDPLVTPGLRQSVLADING